MPRVRARRWAAATVCGAVVAQFLQCFLPTASAADIFKKRDRFGTLHFTNVPTDRNFKVMLREKPVARWPGPGVRASARILDSRTFDPIIADVAGRYRVEQALVKAVIKAESSFQPHAVSRKGARGLMQLMPGTALMHSVRNVHEPRENIEGGVQHLRMLLDRYGGNVVLALAAYNAGEGAVDQHGGIPPFRETRDYVFRVLQFRQLYLQQAIARVR
jgi:soluble lytic murein transglycosylase-like protein